MVTVRILICELLNIVSCTIRKTTLVNINSTDVREYQTFGIVCFANTHAHTHTHTRTHMHTHTQTHTHRHAQTHIRNQS